jgi:uncharacterized protein YdaU (DUF1376 family)
MGAKLLAEWFWTDRWIGSSGFLLPMEARGVYREMLTQAWRRGARLPNNHEAIRRAIGATAGEWRRAWPQLAGFWRVDGPDLVNDTQLAIYLDAQTRSARASAHGSRAARAKHAHSPGTARALLEQQPPSPSPSPFAPPYAPPGGRLTKRDLREAERVRARAFGRCPHSPTCAVYDDCVRLIAASRKAAAS